VPNNPETIAPILVLVLLVLLVQSVGDAGQHAARKHGHARACAAYRLYGRRGTHAVGKCVHHACHTNARLNPEILCLRRKLRHLAAQIGTHRVAKPIGDGRIVLFQLAQAGERLFQIVVGEILPARGELLQGVMRRAGGLDKGFVKLSHRFSEELTCDGTAGGGIAACPAKHGVDNLSDRVGINPALL
jgi:hypothetical protein